MQGSDPVAAIFGAFALLWCGGVLVGIAQLIMAIVALIQILGSKLPAEQKALWAIVSWMVPILGPILWWTSGSKSSRSGETRP